MKLLPLLFSLLAGVLCYVTGSTDLRRSRINGHLLPPAHDGPTRPEDPMRSGGAAKKVASINGSATFSQLLEHKQSAQGTFSQRYWWSTEFSTGLGSPVVLFTPGEIDAEPYVGYMTNQTITGALAEALGAVVIVLEHRYWGESSPYTVLTSTNLTFLTLENSIADLTYFADAVRFPFDPQGTHQAKKAPWVLSGGSYSGALTAWTASTKPGTFWAYHASSAPVEAIYNYWEYFQPVQAGMPRNCSNDIVKVIEHVDHVLLHGNGTEKQELKNLFGLDGIEHDDDFAAVLPDGPYLWQSSTFASPNEYFLYFCDSIEGVANQALPSLPGADGVGLEKALAGYANWTKEWLVPGCKFGFKPHLIPKLHLRQRMG